MSTPILQFEEISTSQADQATTHNQALMRLEAFLIGAETIQNASPGSPTNGQEWIVGTVPTGVWVGHANQLAYYRNSTWYFYIAPPGFRKYNKATASDYVFFGGAWIAAGTSVDATLQAIALLVTAADQVIYATGVDTFAMTTLNALGRGLIGAASQSAARGVIGAAPLDSPVFTTTADAPTPSTGDSSTKIATTALVDAKLAAYIAAQDVLVFKGLIDASTNPNYPAADAGWVYKISVAGKIGGASGPNVEIGDTLYCVTDGSAAGNHATVGANWVIVQVNVDGAVTGPASATSLNLPVFNGATGKIIQDSGVAISTDGTLAANSDLKLATEKAIRTYLAATYAALGVANSFTKAQSVTPVALTDGANIAVNALLSNNFFVTLGGNRTLDNPSDLANGQVINVEITQDGTGSRTLAYGNMWTFPAGAPTLSTAANAVDLISGIYFSGSGKIRASLTKAFS